MLALASCAIAEPGYSKAGAAESELKQDTYTCERDAYMIPKTSMSERKRMFRQCMESKGYTR